MRFFLSEIFRPQFLAQIAVLHSSDHTSIAVRSLYIGTNDGRVLVYPVALNTATKSVSAVFERERALGHGKKPVTDIIVLDDVGIILTLCGTSSFEAIEGRLEGLKFLENFKADFSLLLRRCSADYGHFRDDCRWISGYLAFHDARACYSSSPEQGHFFDRSLPIRTRYDVSDLCAAAQEALSL